ncbi:hypothetical protein HY798_04220 [Candidatus Falkowbacteria bacterium]|nr:hypothetical protein [Candidatus Falkowbacteria bacterium]
MGQELITLGIALDDRPWTPHITLGRAKESIMYKVESIKLEVKNKKITINSFELMESRLSREGTEYKIILSCRT